MWNWITKEVQQLKSNYPTHDPFELADYLGYTLLPYPFKRIRGLLLVNVKADKRTKNNKGGG